MGNVEGDEFGQVVFAGVDSSDVGQPQIAETAEQIVEDLTRHVLHGVVAKIQIRQPVQVVESLIHDDVNLVERQVEINQIDHLSELQRLTKNSNKKINTSNNSSLSVGQPFSDFKT